MKSGSSLACGNGGVASVLDAELAALAGTGDETTLCDPPPALHACERRWESSSKSTSLPQPLLSSEPTHSLPHPLPAMAVDKLTVYMHVYEYYYI